jgi:hypothetical protein
VAAKGVCKSVTDCGEALVTGAEDLRDAGHRAQS